MEYIDYLKEVMPEEKESLEAEYFQREDEVIERDLYFRMEWPYDDYEADYLHNIKHLIGPVRKARKEWQEDDFIPNFYKLSISERKTELEKKYR